MTRYLIAPLIVMALALAALGVVALAPHTDAAKPVATGSAVDVGTTIDMVADVGNLTKADGTLSILLPNGPMHVLRDLDGDGVFTGSAADDPSYLTVRMLYWSNQGGGKWVEICQCPIVR